MNTDSGGAGAVVHSATMKPDVYIIAGPNGAGKTTFAQNYLPRYATCKNFVNADMIAKGVAPFQPEDAAIRAGRVMLGEIDRYIARRESFGFETTLSGRVYLSLFKRMKRDSYSIHLYFLYLTNADLAVRRIRSRVQRGGHNIPEEVVRRRFARSQMNFVTGYRELADEWKLFDNSGLRPEEVAYRQAGEVQIIDAERYNQFQANLQ